MASVPIKVPAVGESITEGILARWLKPDGAAVKSGEPLFELETDKASQEIPAESDGTLQIEVQEGETVEVGATVGTLDPDATPREASTAGKPASTPPSKASPEPTTTARTSSDSAPTSEPKHPTGGDGSRAAVPLSPAVRRLTTEEGLDAAKIEGTGREGRVTKGDVLAHLETERTPFAAPETTRAPRSAPTTTRPAARPETSDRQTRQRMSGIRQKIAQRLVEAQQTAAILTTFNEADMSRIQELRSRYKEPFKEKNDVGLGFMSFFVRAIIEALKAFPMVNGRVEGNEIVSQQLLRHWGCRQHGTGPHGADPARRRSNELRRDRVDDR